jgi:hypothetical protein
MPKLPHSLLSRAEAYVTINPPTPTKRRGELIIDLEGMLIDAIILLKASGVPKVAFMSKCDLLFDAIEAGALDVSKCEVVFATPSSDTTH